LLIFLNPDVFLQFMQGLCTAVSMLALFPLGELFFFHMLLIKKVSMEEVNMLLYVCNVFALLVLRRYTKHSLLF